MFDLLLIKVTGGNNTGTVFVSVVVVVIVPPVQVEIGGQKDGQLVCLELLDVLDPLQSIVVVWFP